MQSRQIASVSTVAFFWCAACCQGQEVSPSYEHLTFLEPFIGQRQVMETKEGKTKAAGIEDATWVLNKSCVRHVGWGEFEETPIRYGFVTGWNPKSKQVFQWGAGGNHLVTPSSSGLALAIRPRRSGMPKQKVGFPTTRGTRTLSS